MSDWNASCPTLELTETLAMRDVTTAMGVLDSLRTMGFGISLDDFGTVRSQCSFGGRALLRQHLNP